MDRIRVAVVGTGGIFRGAHLGQYPNVPELEPVALSDVSGEALESARKAMEYVYKKRAEEDPDGAERLRRDVENVKLFRDTGEMLKEAKPDLVDICAHAGAHAPLAVECLRAGAHVMCEKPMARTWLECVEVVEAVKETGRFYQHMEQWIFEPKWYTAAKTIAAGRIGEVSYLAISAAHGGPESNAGFWDPFKSGGGALLDMGIHALTTAWYLAGLDMRPVRVKAAEPVGLARRMPLRIIGGMQRVIEAEDDGHILVEFAGPRGWTTALIEGSWTDADSPPTSITGTSGEMRFIQRDGETFLCITDSKGSSHETRCHGPLWESYPNGFFGEIRNMARCILSGTPPLIDAEIGAESSAVVDAAYLSEARGREPVEVKELKARELELREKLGAEKASDELIRERIKTLKGR